ncbi:ATP-binding protein [Roseateles sp. MS654]|uniref:ATP-binding protein n=1 Tax=Roseateles sp. MS654 TaxID=3412685 RepID=UPI003C30B7BE
MAAAHWQSGGQTGGSHFEDNYLVRTLGPMADDVEFALTELVANAWDTGASLVDLTIPVRYGEVLTIEDDGHGMTAAQFRDRWMKLGYDRLKHQGATVEFPPSRSTWRRHAYGRHGVARHLPDVNRIREGLASRFLHDPQFVIRVNGGSRPTATSRTSTSAGPWTARPT